jgi:hypothetical protein
MSFLLLLLCLLVLLTNKPTSGATCEQVPTISLPPRSSSDRPGRKQKECAIVRASVRSFVRARSLVRSLTSSRLYNTLINTYTIGLYKRIIRLLLVFYVHITSKVLPYWTIVILLCTKTKSIVLWFWRIFTFLFTYLSINLDCGILILRIPSYLSTYPSIWFTIF